MKHPLITLIVARLLTCGRDANSMLFGVASGPNLPLDFTYMDFAEVHVLRVSRAHLA
jgi:hypothetical protein